MFKDTDTGSTHYVGDGCNPPHPPIWEVKYQPTAEDIIQMFQDYADKNEDENVRIAILKIKEELKK